MGIEQQFDISCAAAKIQTNQRFICIINYEISPKYK